MEEIEVERPKKRKYKKGENQKHLNMIMDKKATEKFLCETTEESVSSIDLLLKKFKKWERVR